jgi:hypothetical protein
MADLAEHPAELRRVLVRRASADPPEPERAQRSDMTVRLAHTAPHLSDLDRAQAGSSSAGASDASASRETGSTEATASASA